MVFIAVSFESIEKIPYIKDPRRSVRGFTVSITGVMGNIIYYLMPCESFPSMVDLYLFYILGGIIGYKAGLDLEKKNVETLNQGGFFHVFKEMIKRRFEGKNIGKKRGKNITWSAIVSGWNQAT